MAEQWLVIDTSYLAYRSLYAFGQLSHESIPTSVTFGVLRDTLSLQNIFMTPRTVFCFDVGKSLRCESYPDYKAHRVSVDKEKEKSLIEVKNQARLLREEYLPGVGFKNVLSAKGYEADDVVASVVRNLPSGDSAIIIASDSDLYQLLSDKCFMYNPGKKEVVTKASFMTRFGIHPKKWARVKAIAGCATDNVIGVEGVGEITAVKYLKGELKEESKLYKRIQDSRQLIERNLTLTKLPYPDTPKFELHPDEISHKKWNELCGKMGMKSLVDKLPLRG